MLQAVIPLLVLTSCVLGLLVTGCRGREDVMPARVPNDLRIEAIAGSLVPGEEDRTLEIRADGTARFVRSKPSQPGVEPIEDQSFTVSPEQLAGLWTAIQANHFFAQPAQHGREDVSDGAFATITITAEGRTHAVEARNVPLEPLENLIRAINEITPPGKDLIYKPPQR